MSRMAIGLMNACGRRGRAGHRSGGRRRRALRGRGHGDRQGRPLRRGDVVRPRPHDAARRVARPHGAPRRRLLQHLLVRRVPRARRQPLRRPRPGRRLGGDLALGDRATGRCAAPATATSYSRRATTTSCAWCSAPPGSPGASAASSASRAAHRSTPHDVAVLEAVSPIVAAAFRTHAALMVPTPGFTHAPGLMLFNRDGAIISANDAASRWLAEIYGDDPEHQLVRDPRRAPEPRRRRRHPDHPADRPGTRRRLWPRRPASPAAPA